MTHAVAITEKPYIIEEQRIAITNVVRKARSPFASTEAMGRRNVAKS